MLEGLNFEHPAFVPKQNFRRIAFEHFPDIQVLRSISALNEIIRTKPVRSYAKDLQTREQLPASY